MSVRKLGLEMSTKRRLHKRRWIRLAVIVVILISDLTAMYMLHKRQAQRHHQLYRVPLYRLNPDHGREVHAI